MAERHAAAGAPTRAHRPGRGPVVVITAGVAVLLVGLAAAGLALRDDGPSTVGSATVQRLASPTPDSAASGSVPVHSGALPTGPAEAVRPSTLRIPKLALTARVDPVGIDAATGDFAVPPGVDVVGWYRHGPGLDATSGSVVIAGHVDSAEQGRGAFFRLREVAPGDQIAVTGVDAESRTYTVVAREVFAKSALPIDRYFARDGAMRLTLITCGGAFDRRTGHYRDNVIVTAVPG